MKLNKELIKEIFDLEKEKGYVDENIPFDLKDFKIVIHDFPRINKTGIAIYHIADEAQEDLLEDVKYSSNKSIRNKWYKLESFPLGEDIKNMIDEDLLSSDIKIEREESFDC